MWVISGPFLGGEIGEASSDRSRLLCPGKSYTLGRKNAQLVVNNKKISTSHLVFTVAPMSESQVRKPGFMPKLQVCNPRDKPIRILRHVKSVEIAADAMEELQSGDQLLLLIEVTLSVKWVAVSCYFSPSSGSPPITLKTCSQLGIGLLNTINSDVTHHITSTYSLTSSIMHSLLSLAHLVNPGWLSELGGLGKTQCTNGLSSLENHFKLPTETEFRPSFLSSLPSSLKQPRLWDLNEARLHLFAELRFVFVGEKGREVDGALGDVVSRGGGSFEGFDITGNLLRWSKLLQKAKNRVDPEERGQRVVAVADSESMKLAVGECHWTELVREAKRQGVAIVSPNTILHAVATAKIEIFFSSDETERGKAIGTSPPILGFDSQPDAHQPRVPTTSDAIVNFAPPIQEQGPTHQDKNAEEAETAPPRRKLVRRAKSERRPVIVGIDDLSMDAIDVEADNASPKALELVLQTEILGLSEPSATGRSSRLKRRTGNHSNAGFTITLDDDEENTEQPPLKKFKALFEASDPSRMGTQGLTAATAEFLQTQGQTLTPGSSTQANSGVDTYTNLALSNAHRLDAVTEEEENTVGIAGPFRGTKRGANEMIPDTMDVDSVQESWRNNTKGLVQSPPRKKLMKTKSQAKDHVPPEASPDPQIIKRNSSTGIPKSISKTEVRKPDTDDAFLQALASTKKGQRHEDDFDRDFNNLRISKPNLNRQQPEQDWRILEDFGNETNVRGNFMVVVEIDVPERRDEFRTSVVREEWQDVPNFKKFKRKSSRALRSKIELVATEEDYSVGTVYWESSQVLSQSHVHPQTRSQEVSSSNSAVIPRTKTKPASQRKLTKIQESPIKTHRGRGFIVDDSDDELDPSDEVHLNVDLFRPSGDWPQSRSLQSDKHSQTSRLQYNDPLFLNSDDELNNDHLSERELDEITNGDTTTLASHEPSIRGVKSTARGRRGKPVILDDDSDDGAFKGFKSKQRG